VGLVLAVAGAAQAIQFLQPYSGPIRFKFESWDMGAVYDVSNTNAIPRGSVIQGIAALDALPQYPPPGGIQPIPSGPYQGQNEDGWGIFRVTEIRSDDGLSTLLWSGALDSQREVVGMIYGAVDNALYVDAVTGKTTIQSDGYMFAMYEQGKGNFSPADGSSDRLSFSKYEGVGFDSGGNMLSGATLVLSGNATTGVTPLASGTASSLTHFTAIDGTTGYGKGEMYVDITGGAWSELFETNGAFNPPSADGDLFAQSTKYAVTNPPTEGFDWTNTNDDPIRGVISEVPPSVIPEPLSILAIVSGIGGLGAYLRRRAH
jgi:hypothetical protein